MGVQYVHSQEEDLVGSEKGSFLNILNVSNKKPAPGGDPTAYPEVREFDEDPLKHTMQTIRTQLNNASKEPTIDAQGRKVTSGSPDRKSQQLKPLTV